LKLSIKSVKSSGLQAFKTHFKFNVFSLKYLLNNPFQSSLGILKVLYSNSISSSGLKALVTTVLLFKENQLKTILSSITSNGGVEFPKISQYLVFQYMILKSYLTNS